MPQQETHGARTEHDVGIHEQHERCLHPGQSGIAGVGRAAVLLEPDQLGVVAARDAGDLLGLCARTVVDDDRPGVAKVGADAGEQAIELLRPPPRRDHDRDVGEGHRWKGLGCRVREPRLDQIRG
jgi:hypothetical protein